MYLLTPEIFFLANKLFLWLQARLCSICSFIFLYEGGRSLRGSDMNTIIQINLIIYKKLNNIYVSIVEFNYIQQYSIFYLK